MSDTTLADDVGRTDGDFETFRPCASERRSAEILHPLSGEQRFWLTALERLLAPAGGRGGALSRAVTWVTVVPLTNFTPFSLTYQAYLNLIFHRSAVARIGHSIFIPLTVFWLMVSACPIVGEAPSTHTIGASTLLAWNGAAVVAIVLAIWYAAWAALERSLLWGITSVTATAVMWIGANAYWTALHLGGGAPWYAPTPAPATPLLWMAVSAMLLALSHVGEPAFPPRMNGTTHWIPMRRYMGGEPELPFAHMSRVERLGRVAGHLICGPIDEWMAAPRLFPVYLLELLFVFGYQPARRAELRALVARCVAGDDPALDYVGTGGGTLLQRIRSGGEESRLAR